MPTRGNKIDFKMIREIQLKDKEQWKKLYRGYANFYKVEMNDKILETVWKWLNDNNHELKGIGYEADGKIVGCVKCNHGRQNHDDEWREAARKNEEQSQKRDADFG